MFRSGVPLRAFTVCVEGEQKKFSPPSGQSEHHKKAIFLTTSRLSPTILSCTIFAITMAAIVSNLIEQLSGIVSTDFKKNDPTRLQLALAARKVFHELETPGEKTMRLAIEEPIMFSVLQATIDMGLWDAWTAAAGGEKHVKDLAMMANQEIDAELLREHRLPHHHTRLLTAAGHQMRLLAANQIVREVKEDTYAPTTYSFALGDKSAQLAPGLRIR